MKQRIQVGDVRMNVMIVGSGSPILLVHGFPLDHTMWSEQITPLSANHRVIVPDLRGFGKSDFTPGTVPMKLFADDLAALLDALQITEPVTFCGLSMGGYIAWQFWARHAQRLRKLIVCDTRAVADPEEVSRARLVTAERVLSQGATVVADSMLARFFSPNSRINRAAALESLRQVMLQTNPHGIAAALRGMACRHDMTTRLSEIAVPTLVLCGEHDEISRAAEMQGIAAQIPNARYVEIADAGHMAPLEKPAEANAAILEFLREGE